jgi:UDP-N-acetylmuramate dehydrogenase
VHDITTLRNLCVFLHNEGIPFFIVGRGSNLLVGDQGFEGTVIILDGELARVNTGPDNGFDTACSVIVAGGGASISDLISFCRLRGLGGLEFLSGIPGTVGGALYMNAGAFGEEISSRVQDIRILVGAKDRLVKLKKQDLRFSYRKLEMEKETIIIGASFMLAREDKDVIACRIAGYLKRRKNAQPMGCASAGSVFKNPPDGYAAKLIQEAGLKGKRIGGAMISEKHANFIVNTGDATASDIISLLNLCKRRVKDITGIELEPEIQIVP